MRLKSEKRLCHFRPCRTKHVFLHQLIIHHSASADQLLQTEFGSSFLFRDPQFSLLNGACQVRYSKKVRDLEAADGERWVGEAVIFSGAAEPGSSVLHPADA